SYRKMKRIITLLLKMKPGLILCLLSLWVIACKSNVEKSGDLIPATDPENPDLIILNRNQFETSSMELGKMQDYSFRSSLKINGMVEVPPEGRAEISSFYGGYVSGLSLLTGQSVKKGERLFSLENPEYIQMQQDFLEAKSQLSYLQSDYERQKTLRQENIASQKNFLRAESDYQITLARLEGLKKKLSQLNLNPEEITPEHIRSSISVYAQ